MVWTKENRKRYYNKNKEKFQEYRKRYREKHQDKIKSLNKQYRIKNPKKIKLLYKIWREKHLEELKKKAKIYYEKNKQRIKENEKRRFKKYRSELKMKVFQHYGMKCSCCGEDKFSMLTIDHINNDGAEHRKKIGGSSKTYLWLINNNFPKDFQTLCFNCNISKEINGVCEHQTR